MEPALISLMVGVAAGLLSSRALAGAGAGRQRTLRRLESIVVWPDYGPGAERSPGEREGGRAQGRKAGGTTGSRMQLELHRAGLRLRPREFLLVRAGIAAILLYATSILGSLWLLPVAVAAAYWGPGLYLRRRQGKRLARIEGQLPETLSLLANGLRAGLSLLQALDAVIAQTRGPLPDEIRRLLRDTSLGLDLDEAFGALSARVGSRDLDIVVTAILVQRGVGGNLAEILDEAAGTIRERERIRGEIKALTAQQRMSGYIIALLPVFVGGIFYLINPAYMTPLFTTVGGKVLLVAAGLMELVGLLIIQRIVAIDV